MITTPTIVEVQNVSKRFVMHKDKSLKERILNLRSASRHRDDFLALDDVSLDIPIGSTVGLVGHNGSGKSTLLKVIGGIIEPSAGAVRRRGRLAALLELGAGFHPDLTGRENVYLNAAILGLSTAETDRQFDSIVDFSGIEEFIDTQVKFYSSGMYVRLAFAVAVHSDPDLLLVDEVLAVGDEPFQRKCMDRITQFQAEGRTIVLVSHSADQVGALCDRVAVLDRGRLLHYGDTPTGLRILRQSFADGQARHDVAHSTTTDDQHGLHLVGVQVGDGSGAPIPSGGSVTVHVDYEIVRNVVPWVIGVAIETPLGHPVYRVRTDDIAVALPTEPGSFRYSLELDRLSLGSGSYNLSIGMARAEGGTIAVANPAASFDVVEAGLGRGIVSLSPVARNEAVD